MFRNLAVAALAAVAIEIGSTGPALADFTPTNGLPGPGVFPLIALGIAGAIALAKLRK